MNENEDSDNFSDTGEYSTNNMNIIASTDSINSNNSNNSNNNKDFCIICYEPDDLVLYNHCGKIMIHPKCLLLWMATQNNACLLCRCDIQVEHCLDDYVFNLDVYVFKHKLENIYSNHNFINYYLTNVQNTRFINESNYFSNFKNNEIFFNCLRNRYCIKFIHRLNEKNEITLSFFEPKYNIILSDNVTTYMYYILNYYYYYYIIGNGITSFFSWYSVQKSFCLIAIFIGYIAEYLIGIFLGISIYIFIQCRRGLTYVDDSTFY